MTAWCCVNATRRQPPDRRGHLPILARPARDLCEGLDRHGERSAGKLCTVASAGADSPRGTGGGRRRDRARRCGRPDRARGPRRGSVRCRRRPEGTLLASRASRETTGEGSGGTHSSKAAALARSADRVCAGAPDASSFRHVSLGRCYRSRTAARRPTSRAGADVFWCSSSTSSRPPLREDGRLATRGT